MPKGIYIRKPFTEDHKKNMSKASTGRKQTKESKIKIGLGSLTQKVPHVNLAHIIPVTMPNIPNTMPTLTASMALRSLSKSNLTR